MSDDDTARPIVTSIDTSNIVARIDTSHAFLPEVYKRPAKHWRSANRSTSARTCRTRCRRWHPTPSRRRTRPCMTTRSVSRIAPPAASVNCYMRSRRCPVPGLIWNLMPPPVRGRSAATAAVKDADTGRAPDCPSALTPHLAARMGRSKSLILRFLIVVIDAQRLVLFESQAGFREVIQ
jgi:hypothetical protein